MNDTDTINLRDFFSLPLKEARALFEKLVLDPRALFEKLVLDPRPLEPGEMICPKCSGVGGCACYEGKCPECEGKGQIDHECDCKLCKEVYEDCDKCNGTGDFQKCHENNECSLCNQTGRVSDEAYWAFVNPAPTVILVFGKKEK